MKPENKVNFKRLINSTRYSLQGLRAAYRFEAAFRQEVWLALFFIPASFFVGENVVEILLLLGAVCLVLITELLNSAVEAIVDRVGTDYHELSGRAKDIGSAAVFISLLLFGIVWLSLLIF